MIRPSKKLCVVAVSFFALVLMLDGCSASWNSSTPEPPRADTTAPTAPGGLSASASSSPQIGLSWTASTDNVGVAGYRVERCTGIGCTTFAQIANVAATTFSDSGLLSGTSYSYRVRATDAAGNLSSYSNLASATTPAGASIAVSVSPTATTVTIGSAQSFAATVQNDSQNKGVSWSLS